MVMLCLQLITCGSSPSPNLFESNILGQLDSRCYSQLDSWIELQLGPGWAGAGLVQTIHVARALVTWCVEARPGWLRPGICFLLGCIMAFGMNYLWLESWVCRRRTALNTLQCITTVLSRWAVHTLVLPPPWEHLHSALHLPRVHSPPDPPGAPLELAPTRAGWELASWESFTIFLASQPCKVARGNGKENISRGLW